MKKFTISLAILVGPISAICQPAALHEWNAQIAVADEAGQPVAGADVAILFSAFTSADKRISTNVSGLTGSNGIFEASHAYTHSPGMLFRASKAGFYPATQHYDLGDGYDAGRWNPKTKLLLKRISRPIPMYAKRVDSLPPATGKPVGFDLAVGDWVAPYGSGRLSDLIFLWDYVERSRLDYEGKLTLTFPNVGDGIQEYAEDPGGSSLASPHEAQEGGYQPGVERVNISHPPATVQ